MILTVHALQLYGCSAYYQWKKKMESFLLKKLSHWMELKYFSQIDSILRVNLTRHWASIWLYIESQFDSILRVNLTLYWESIWLDIEGQFDSILRVNLTRYWESIRLDIESQFDSNILQLLGIPGRILLPPVTQLLRSKWLIFFFQCCCRIDRIILPHRYDVSHTLSRCYIIWRVVCDTCRPWLNGETCHLCYTMNLSFCRNGNKEGKLLCSTKNLSENEESVKMNGGGEINWGNVWWS